MDRKDLLLKKKEGDEPKREVTEDEHKKNLEEGGAFLEMTDTYGWKILREKFIDPRISKDRLYSADRESLAETRAAMFELEMMIKLVEKSIDAGIRSHEVLKKKLNKEDKP